MAAGAVEGPDLVEWWPAVQRLAAWRARAWDVETDDLAQTTAMLVLQRLRRGQEWWGYRTLRLCALEAVRIVRSPESRAGRGQRLQWDDIPGPGGAVFELCSIPGAPEPIEDPDEETARHRREWETMGLRERQSRIIESHRALGSSGG